MNSLGFHDIFCGCFFSVSDLNESFKFYRGEVVVSLQQNLVKSIKFLMDQEILVSER